MSNNGSVRNGRLRADTCVGVVRQQRHNEGLSVIIVKRIDDSHPQTGAYHVAHVAALQVPHYPQVPRGHVDLRGAQSVDVDRAVVIHEIIQTAARCDTRLDSETGCVQTTRRSGTAPSDPVHVCTKVSDSHEEDCAKPSIHTAIWSSLFSSTRAFMTATNSTMAAWLAVARNKMKPIHIVAPHA